MEIQEPTRLSTNSWRLLGRELWQRFVFPWPHYSFVTFFFVTVVGFGGLGVWLEIFGEHGKPATQDAMLRTALLATFPALVGTSCLQLVWSEEEKYIKTFAMGVFVANLVVALLFARPTVSDASAIFAYALATIFALLMWWIANAYQPEFLDHNPEAPTGGDAEKAKLPGSLTEYKT